MNKVEGSPAPRVSMQERLIRHTLAVVGGGIGAIGVTAALNGNIQEGMTIAAIGGALSAIAFSPR